MREKQREELEEQARRQKAEDERAREQRQQEVQRKKELVRVKQCTCWRVVQFMHLFTFTDNFYYKY